MVNKIIKNILIIFILATTLTLGINKVSAVSHTFINYYGIEMTDTEYMNLINLGFTENEIYYMDEDTYNDNKDIEAVLVAKTTKYYKTVVPYYGASYTTETTLEEYLNFQNGAHTLDYSATYFQEFATMISYKNATKYRYKMSTTWLNMPSNYSYDVMGIGFMDDVYVNSALFFRHNWYYSDGTSGSSITNNGQQISATGASVVYQLPTNVVGMDATFYYDVSKETTDTISELSMCGDYAHSLYPVTYVQAGNHAISYGGIGFDSSVVANFNAIPCTYAAAVNLNW